MSPESGNKEKTDAVAGRGPAKTFSPGKGALVTLVAIALFNCMGGAAVAPALPAISEAFPGSSETLVSLIITMPSLAVAISGLFVGAIADKVGKARTLAAALVLFTASGLSGVFLPTVETILVGRFLMGIGIAGISAASTALVSDYYDGDMRAKVYGWQSAATGASVLLLETTGGFLALLGWRVPFFVYAVGIPLLVMTCLFIREANRAGDAAHEEPGRVSAEGRDSREARFVLAVCLVTVFLIQVMSFLVPSKMPYLVASFGGDSAVSGLFLGAMGIANIGMSLVFPRLQARFKRSALLTVSFIALVASAVLLGLSTGLLTVLVGTIASGAGVGLAMPLLVNWLAATSTPQNSGKRMGAFTTAMNLGQFACSLTAGAILALVGTYQAVFLTAAAVGAVYVIALTSMRALAHNQG